MKIFENIVKSLLYLKKKVNFLNIECRNIKYEEAITKEIKKKIKIGR